MDVIDRWNSKIRIAVNAFLVCFQMHVLGAGLLPEFSEVETMVSISGTDSNWGAQDLDGDGDADLVMPGSPGEFQVWLQGGPLSFQELEGSVISYGTDLKFGDLDGDGDVDIWVSPGRYATQGSCKVWFNDGSGRFELSDQTLPTAGAYTLLEDLNNDGLLDALIMVGADDFHLDAQSWLNDGSGVFSMKSSHLFGGFGYVPIALGDVNGDHLPDLVEGVDGELYLNTGESGFRATGQRLQVMLQSNFNTSDNVRLVDLDGDGDLDAIVPMEFGAVYDGAFLNAGDGTFNALPDGSIPLGQYIVTGDMEGDGDVDLIIQSSGSSSIRYLLNDGDASFQSVFSMAGVDADSKPVLVDLEGDGDLDLLAIKGGQLTAVTTSFDSEKDPVHEIETIQVPRFLESRRLTRFASDMSSWAVEDLDGDQDLDLIVPAASGEYEVLLQEGELEFIRSDEGLLTGGRHLVMGDVDADGDLDAWLSAGSYRDGGPCRLWLNDGAGDFSLPKQPQSLPRHAAKTHLDDFNGDGSLDAVVIVYSSDFDSEVQIWTNDGQGSFQYQHSFKLPCFGAVQLDSGDVDDDGDADLFLHCMESSVWLNHGDAKFENTGQSFNEFPLLAASQSQHVKLLDLDFDDDLDAVVAEFYGNSLVFYNQGQGIFEKSNTPLMEGSHFLDVGDLDQDGDIDLVLDHQHDQFLQIYLNDQERGYRRGFNVFGVDSNVPPRLVDIDSDGDLDLLYKKGIHLEAYLNEIAIVEAGNHLEDVEFPDPGFETLIRESLNLPLGVTLTEEQLKDIRVLDISPQQRVSHGPSIVVSDFTGLNQLAALRSIKVSNLNRFDINLLSDLKLLRELIAVNIQIQDPSFLSNFPDIEILDLSFNAIKTLGAELLASGLRVLVLNSNRLVEFRFPENLVALEEIRLDMNRLNSIVLSPWLGQLEYFSAMNNQLQTLEIDPETDRLTELWINDNRLEALEIPKTLTKLTKIVAWNNRVARIEFGAESLSSLKELFLDGTGNRLESFTFLNALPSLERLNINGRGFDPLSLNAPLSKLRSLIVDVTGVPSFQLPEGYGQLEMLLLQFGSLEALVLPNDLSNLMHLGLSSNRLKEFHFPEGMHSLETVELFNNQLEVITFSEDLTSIQQMILGGNQLTAVSIPPSLGVDASGTPNVDLYNNPIRSLTVAENWPGNVSGNQGLFRQGTISFNGAEGFGVDLDILGYGRYRIQKTTDFKKWTTVRTIDGATANEPIRLDDKEAGSSPAAFYRIRSL